MASEMIERVAKAIKITHNHTKCDLYEALAEAAIKAMGEPTEEMILIGNRFLNLAPKDVATMKAVWLAMIDAALKE